MRKRVVAPTHFIHNSSHILDVFNNDELANKIVPKRMSTGMICFYESVYRDESHAQMQRLQFI